MDDLQQPASACLSLAYKYTSLRGCVKDQRPELLSDPVLAMLDAQIEALNEAFDQRVQALALV